MARDPSQPSSGKREPSRQERLAEALRANLRRRKAQSRARKEGQGKDRATPRDEAGRH